jgi:hypothetical protein
VISREEEFYDEDIAINANAKQTERTAAEKKK